jgi:hypothetical protein
VEKWEQGKHGNAQGVSGFLLFRFPPLPPACEVRPCGRSPALTHLRSRRSARTFSNGKASANTAQVATARGDDGSAFPMVNS